MATEVALSSLNDWLSSQSTNTVSTPYDIVVTGTGSSIDTSGGTASLYYILRQNSTKYVKLSFTSEVISFSADAINNCKTVVELVLPDSVTSIGMRACKGCTNLKTVTISSACKSIDEMAFYECTSLTNVTIPKTVESISSQVFYGCTGLASVTFETDSKCNSMGSVFYGCTGLTSITLPDSIETLKGTFYGCTGLTSITLPASLSYLGENTFYNCTFITESATQYLSTSSGKKWLYRLVTKDTSYTIDSDCIGIAEYSTRARNSTGYYLGTPNLATLVIPEGFKYFTKFDSSYDKKLTTINIPSTVSKIPVSCFESLKLSTVSFSSNISNLVIEKSAFYGCSLTSISLPKSTKSIGTTAFYRCPITSIIVGEEVKSIASDAFSGCTFVSTTDATYISTTSGKKWLYSVPSALVASFTFDTDCFAIGNSVFSGTSFSGSIPTSIKIIDDYAFKNVSGLDNLLNLSSVVRIGAEAFYGNSCTALVIPLTTTEIGSDAFASESLNTIYLMQTVDGLTTYNNCFADITNESLKIIVPSANLSAWKAVTASDYGLASTDVFVSTLLVNRWLRIA